MRIAHDSSFCGRSQGDFASAEARRWLSDRPRHPFGPLLIDWYQVKRWHGRGGSVSRRDHNQAYRRRATFQAEPTEKNCRNPNASRSSGKGGLGGEALLSSTASPQKLPSTSSLREGASLQRAPSLAITYSIIARSTVRLFSFGVGATDDEDHQENGANVGEGRGQGRREANGLQTHSQRVNETKEQRSEENLRRV